MLIKGIIKVTIPLTYLIIFSIFTLFFSPCSFDFYYLACELCGGGLIFGAFFMATDYVTSPMDRKGQIVYGIILGILTGLFRCFLMNLKKIIKDVFILCLITIICGGLMGYVYQITKKPIEKQAKQTQQEAYKLVMKKATSFKKYEVQKIKKLSKQLKNNENNVEIVQALKAYQNKKNIGEIIQVIDHDGFGGDIELIVGINQQKEIKKIQESIDTLKSFNREKSIKRAESKEKQLAKIERIDRPENLPSAITVQFTPAIESGYDVLKVNDLSMRYDQIVFEHCNLDIKKGERVAIVGENGVGKTTLFKALVGQLPIEHGKIRFGSHVEMAYYDQEHESLNYNKTIFDEISDCYPRMTNQEIRSTLAMFNFRGDDVFKDIAMLSGGERGRVVLTEVLLKQANFLILDEPTNHLDISSKEVLEEALRSFEGTILFISHDRYFINKIATRVIEVQKDQCLSYNGNYDDYLNQKTPVVETTQKVVTEAKQRQIIDKKTKNEIKKLERTIDSLEKEINSLKEELTSEEVMNNYKKYNEITDSIEEKEMELMEIMEKWEQLQA